MSWHQFTSLTPIGLDLGERRIKVVQLAGRDPRRRLEAVASMSRSEAAGSEEPMAAAEVERVCGMLRRRGFRGRRVVLAVPNSAALTSVLELPPRSSGAPLEQIAEAELARAHRRESGTLEVAFWDLPTPVRSKEGSRFMAAGCPRDEADALVGVLEAAGLEVCGLDLKGWAIARACRSIIEQSPGMVAALDMGWSSATLVLLHQGVVVYERSLGGAALKTLSAALERDDRLDEQVIEYLLQDVGFETGVRGHDDDWALRVKGRGHLESHLEQIVKELRLAMAYAQHQYPDQEVRRVLLVGGGAGIPGIAGHLSESLEADVSSVGLAGLFDASNTDSTDASSPALTVAAGLALFDEREAA